jgi:formate/nitrite transporter FocA (FNT family)
MGCYNKLLTGYLAGVCISIGGIVYLLSENKIVGSILFSIALLTICFMNLALYTGRIGFIVDNFSKQKVIDIIYCFIGNILGVLSIGLLWPKTSNLYVIANKVVENKISHSLYISFINAFMCGIIMYIAVWIYKNKNSVIGILFGIPTFILSGFEHSIADMFYIILSKSFSIDILLFILIVFVGNTIGSIFFSIIFKNSSQRE